MKERLKPWLFFLVLCMAFGTCAGLFAAYVTRSDPERVFASPWPVDGILLGLTVGAGFWGLCLLGGILTWVGDWER